MTNASNEARARTSTKRPAEEPISNATKKSKAVKPEEWNISDALVESKTTIKDLGAEVAKLKDEITTLKAELGWATADRNTWLGYWSGDMTRIFNASASIFVYQRQCLNSLRNLDPEDRPDLEKVKEATFTKDLEKALRQASPWRLKEMKEKVDAIVATKQ